MLRAKTSSGLQILGLDAENIKRLMEGQPIVVSLAMTQGTDDVMILYGETLDAVRAQLEGVFGEMPKAKPLPRNDADLQAPGVSVSVTVPGRAEPIAQWQRDGKGKLVAQAGEPAGAQEEPLKCAGCGKTIAEHARLLHCSVPAGAQAGEWREHPANIDTDWYVSADGKVLAEVGSINLGGGAPYYAVVGAKRLDHRYVARANAQRDVEAHLTTMAAIPEAKPATEPGAGPSIETSEDDARPFDGGITP